MDTKSRLEELLTTFYTSLKDNHGKEDSSLYAYIQGFIEASLIHRSISRSTVEQIINNTHRTVFGIDFKSRHELEKATEDWLDIPTHVRQNKLIDLEK